MFMFIIGWVLKMVCEQFVYFEKYLFTPFYYYFTKNECTSKMGEASWASDVSDLRRCNLFVAALLVGSDKLTSLECAWMSYKMYFYMLRAFNDKHKYIW